MTYHYILHRPLPRIVGFVAVLIVVNLFFYSGVYPPVMTMVLAAIFSTALIYGINYWRWLIESYRITNEGLHIERRIGDSRFVPFADIRRADRIEARSLLTGARELLILHAGADEKRHRIDLLGLDDAPSLLAQIERHVTVNHLDRFGREIGE